MRLGVLVSGRGSNLEAILDAGLSVALVVSNRPGVRALEVAAAHGVPATVLRRSDHADASARDAAIGAALAEAGVELAVLAGWDQLLRPSYFAAFAGRTINVHPSLLPAHGGAGMMGLEVHRSVLDAGDVETGVTIHDVTRGARRRTDPGAGPGAGEPERRSGHARGAGPGRGASAARGDPSRARRGHLRRTPGRQPAGRAPGHEPC